jgi:hypothetical protein
MENKGISVMLNGYLATTSVAEAREKLHRHL